MVDFYGKCREIFHTSGLNTNLDFPEIAGDFPQKNQHLGEIKLGSVMGNKLLGDASSHPAISNPSVLRQRSCGGFVGMNFRDAR